MPPQRNLSALHRTCFSHSNTAKPTSKTRHYLSLNLTKLTRLIQIALTDAYKIIATVIKNYY